MSWFVDNAITLSILFGLVAAALVMIWRSNGQIKYLGFAAGAIALIGLIWLLTLFVPTDRKQLEDNVRAMAKAVEEGKTDDLFKHISKDFAYKVMTRDLLYEAARKSIASNRVKEVAISHFKVEEVSRAKKFAKTRFRVSASAERDYPFVTEADFVLEGDQWRLKTVRFYNPVASLEEIELPGLR